MSVKARRCEAAAPPLGTLDGLLRPGKQPAEGLQLLAPFVPSLSAAALLVLETARACGCDTRVGTVAFVAVGSRLALHMERLQAAAAVWRCSGASRAQLAKACTAFARQRESGDRGGGSSCGEVLLTDLDLVQLRAARPQPPPPVAGAAVVAELAQQATAPTLAASGRLPPWGRPVALDGPWAVATLPVVRALLTSEDSRVDASRYHLAFGGAGSWQLLRTSAELARDEVLCGYGVEALEVGVSWRGGLGVARPPCVLRP